MKGPNQNEVKFFLIYGDSHKGASPFSDEERRS